MSAKTRVGAKAGRIMDGTASVRISGTATFLGSGHHLVKASFALRRLETFFAVRHLIWESGRYWRFDFSNGDLVVQRVQREVGRVCSR